MGSALPLLLYCRYAAAPEQSNVESITLCAAPENDDAHAAYSPVGFEPRNGGAFWALEGDALRTLKASTKLEPPDVISGITFKTLTSSPEQLAHAAAGAPSADKAACTQVLLQRTR